MRASICCIAALMGAMGIATEAAAVGGSDAGLAGKRGLPPIAAATAQGQYDAVYRMCQTVAPVGGADYQDANILTPTSATVIYFQNKNIPIGASDVPKITLVTSPKHGELSGDGYAYGAYLYKPNNGYLGGDSMTFTIEVKKKVFKVIYSVDVVPAPSSGSPSCPDGINIHELSTPTK